MRYLSTADSAMDWTEPTTVEPSLPIPPMPSGQPEFEALSWAELARLAAACASGDGTRYHGLLGLTKPVSVIGVGSVTTRLIGINHDTYTDGGTAGFTFQLCDGLSSSKPGSFKMNDSATSSGGWESSLMRSSCIQRLMAALPSDLRGLIKKVVKMTSTSYSGKDVVETADDLFLLSLVESIGTTETTYTDNPVGSGNYLYYEGTQYEYYGQFGEDGTGARNAHIIKRDIGDAASWGLRSIRMKYSDSFYSMNSEGDLSYTSANDPTIPAVAFCL